jgi:hypothetical protein
VVPSVETSHAEAGWATASVDERLRMGDALRTDARGQARIAIVGEGEVAIGPDSVVRFIDRTSAEGARPEVGLQIESGSLLMVTSAIEDAPALAVINPAGVLRLSPGAQSEITIDQDQQVELNVTVGSAQLESSQGEVFLGAGVRTALDIGNGQRLPGRVLAGRVVVRREGSEQTFSRGDSFDLSRRARTVDAASETTPDAESAPVADATTDEPALSAPNSGGRELTSLRLRRRARTILQAKVPGGETFRRITRRSYKLQPGTILRVGPGGAPLVLPGPGGAVAVVQPGSVVEFEGVDDSTLLLSLRQGQVTGRTSGSGTTSVAMPGGSTETRRLGSSAAFAATVLGPHSSRVSVSAGMAFVNAGGASARAATGATVTLRDGQPPGVAQRSELPLAFPGNTVINDSRPRGAFTVRIPAIKGCRLYAIEVKRGKRLLLDSVSTRPSFNLTDIGYGHFRWRAGCVRQGQIDWSGGKRGQLGRRRDRSGTVVLPSTPPRSTLDSDGRNYTVLYQNLLPVITLKWTRAPQSEGYNLQVFDDLRGKRIYASNASRAQHTFQPGFFNEGTYYWIFHAGGEGPERSSKISRLRVGFNNVMPSIQITEPRPGSPARARVRVRGIVTKGSAVTANGVLLGLDRTHRFDQEVPVGPGKMVVFRVTTRRRGTQYYLRHLSAN